MTVSFEAAGARDDRHAAVAQAIELRQAAGLEARRDDDGVAAGLHEVRHRLVIADGDADAAGMAGGGGQQRAFERRIAGTENRRACRPCATISSAVAAMRSMPFCQVRRLMTQKIGALSSCEPEEFGDRPAVLVAALQRRRAVVGVDDGIGRRVPDVGVDAIDDAVQRIDRRLAMTPSSPMPNSGVRISPA